jgi:hypothetical protein
MFILKNDKTIKFLENEKDVIDFIRNSKIHPDLLEIYFGDIKKIKYEDLLEEIDKEKLNIEVNSLFSQAEEKMKNIEVFNSGYSIEKHLYVNGMVENNIAGFNPVIEFKIGILAEENVYSDNNIPEKIDNKTLKSIFNFDNWEVIKIKNNGLVSKRQFNWREYIVLLTKKRECFLKNG